MTEIARRFAARFRPLFEKGGLRDVKFFLRPDQPSPTALELESEVTRMYDVTTLKPIHSVDGAVPQERFDAPFK
jgi:hypothetical protein